MCDDALRQISTKSASQQDSTGSDAVATPTINNFADLKLAMSEMMSSFKTEILTHVNESISQVYQDFEQVAEPAAQDETIGVSEVEPLPEESGDSLVGKITAFAQQTASQPQTQTNITTESTVFKAFVEQFATAEKPGPAIDHDLATIVNELLTEKLTKDKLEPVQQKYLRPENCENLVTPKINKPIWQQLKQETKNSIAILQVCNSLSSSQNTENHNNIMMLTHSIVLSLAANRELNLKRRDLLRADLNKQYAALCNPSTPVSQYLFGDDLNKEMDDLSKASKLTRKVTPNQRVEPYRRPMGRSAGMSSRSSNSRGRSSSRPGAFLGFGRGQPRNYQRSSQRQFQK